MPKWSISLPAKALRYPGRISTRDKQNLEGIQSKDFQRAIYFKILAGQNSSLIGTVPKDCIIDQGIFINIIEAFDGDNIWIKIGTSQNIESIGKILSHNTGIFQMINSGFGDLPTDYGRVFNEDKNIIVSLAAESPSTNRRTTKGSMFGILRYTNLNEVEGF